MSSEAAAPYDVQRLFSNIRQAQRQILNMGAILDRLEAEASDEECDHGKCFGALAMLLEAIDNEVGSALYYLERETMAPPPQPGEDGDSAL
jgi:hypothetical protein